MSLHFYNTLSQKKEVFVPLNAPKVMFYVCGVTVYDYSHLGHARANVVFDSIRRYLLHLGYEVTFVQNFTDIDDKIIARSNEAGIPFFELTELYIKAFQEDMAQLFILPPTHAPKATDYIPEMIGMIQTLMDKGIAYVQGEDVCFSIDAFPEYGKLSHKILEDLVAGTRVDINQAKKNPLDFVLWKQSKPGEPSWDSPWGKGRPGWHIECSAMAMSLLGDTIDIHGGGEDLVFPHHENEIAQSECCTGKPFASYWVHNGFVTINHEKMSKSKHNFFTIRDILTRYSGAVVRFFLLKAHYRTALNFSYEVLDDAQSAYTRLLTCLRTVSIQDPSDAVKGDFETLESNFFEALNDDFNTAKAIGILFELVTLINTSQAGVSVLRRLGGILGLFEDLNTEIVFSDEVIALADERVLAKKERRFDRADEIRARLKDEHGVLIEDSVDGYRLNLI